MSKKKSDLLDGLAGSSGGNQQKAPPEDSGTSPTAGEAKKSPMGLTSLDLLSLPPDQQKLINWLSRRKQATFRQIQAALGQDESEIERVLATLREANYICPALIEGEVYFRVVFRGMIRRRTGGLLGELWSKVDLDHVTFLKQHPLFQELSEEQIREFADNLNERLYSRDEVIIWQGDNTDQVHFIKSGVVGITRMSTQDTEKKILAYLKTGDILGEFNALMKQGGSASATVTAMSTVSVLTLRKPVFLDYLNRYPSIAVELARLLVQRLIEANTRFSNQMGSKVCLIVETGRQVGATTIGSMLAMTLANVTHKNTAYTEQPTAGDLPTLFHLTPGAETYQQAGGYSIMVPHESAGLPSTLRMTLTLDRLVSQYTTVVIAVPSQSEDTLTYLAQHADQIIVVTTPEPENWIELNRLNTRLRALVSPEKVGLFSVLNRTKPEHQGLPAPGRVDFDLPFIERIPPLDQQCLDNRPDALAAMVTTLADRLGRTNQVSVYIPTTIDVDKAVDTTVYVERTLAFLGQRFGGATTNQAHGVWNSAEAGLVGEDIHIVRSYATQADLDRYLQEILSYVEELKQELRQEAMAVEINQKLMLL